MPRGGRRIQAGRPEPNPNAIRSEIREHKRRGKFARGACSIHAKGALACVFFLSRRCFGGVPSTVVGWRYLVGVGGCKWHRANVFKVADWFRTILSLSAAAGIGGTGQWRLRVYLME